uniref:TraB n=1 Tax=Escherichia coli TaxID=562 RepID=D9Z5P0_ECOLX|nr:TraB [Escherichia coli]
MAFSSWVSIIVTNAVLKFLRLIKKNVKNLLKSMNQTFLTKPLLSNATSLNLRRLTLIQKRWSSFISSQIWNGPSCLFAVIVSVSTSWTTALLAHCGGMLSRSER